MMTKSDKKSSVVISWTINVTKTDTEGKKSESHMDGNVSMEMKDYREFIRETVSSAIKGVADGIVLILVVVDNGLVQSINERRTLLIKS